jgi:hypothetical protein
MIDVKWIEATEYGDITMPLSGAIAQITKVERELPRAIEICCTAQARALSIGMRGKFHLSADREEEFIRDTSRNLQSKLTRMERDQIKHALSAHLKRLETAAVA